MKKWILIIVSIAFAQYNYGQSIIASYSFDNCTVDEDTGNYPNNFVRNNINCECGVTPSSTSLRFDGSADTIFLDEGIKDIFLGDFSMSFYFWVDDAFEEYPLFSINNACQRDSSFLIRYLPFSESIEVKYSIGSVAGVDIRADISQDVCWHHFLLSREGDFFTLYIDGEFVEIEEERTPLALGSNHTVNIGYSQCIDPSLVNSDIFFRGRMDNLVFYDSAINDEDFIQSLLVFPDQLITQDTTIFLGDIADIRSGHTCAPNIDWSPAAGILDLANANTEASPAQTTDYIITYDHGGCQSMDEITISVVSPDNIDCNNILLPSAFTPNLDGLNDEFFISNSFIIEDLSRFEIFDKWGMLLFETTNKDQSWDGNFRGTKMPPSTYIYKIEYDCKGEAFQKTGSFNILK